MYAVIQTGGKQYRVAPGDTIRIERVSGKVGEKVNFGSVLAVHTDDKKVLLGSDAGKATVSGKIIEQGSHDTLLARRGIYASLWAHQSGGFLAGAGAARHQAAT